MSNSKTRPGKGSRSLARSKTASATARRIRTGLLGSTALIAVGLAASPAFAQVTVATPAGGGTVTRTVGSNPSVNDQTAAGGALVISNVSQSTDLRLNGVQINNTTGGGSANALQLTGSTSGLNSTGLAISGVNTLTTTVNGGAALYMTTNANLGVNFLSSGSVFTGSYGLNLSVPGGYISVDSTGQSQSFVANGSAIAGINAISAINASLLIGGSSISGFATGVNAQNYYGTGFVSTGGTISASGTGIRLNATNGQNSVVSQSAITAQTGIHSTAAGDTTGTSTITTSGAGTINSTAAGSGTGILATSAGNLAINAGAAIGDVTRFGTGINATATAGVNLTATAAIGANNGIVVSSAGPISVITSGAGAINGAGTGISVTGTAAAATINVSVGAAIGATTTPQYGVVLNSAGGRVTFSNTASISGTTAGLRLLWGPSFPATGAINIGADIIGGIDASTGMANVYTIAQGATVSGLITTSFGTGALITNNTGSSLVNSGTIISTGGGTNNSAVRHLSGGPTTNTATGVISGRTGIAGNGSNATPTTNAGSIIGTGTTSTEAGIVTGGGLITNSGSISGGYGGIRSVNNFLTLNNLATGTVTGAVNGVSDEASNGRFTITNAGVIQTLGGTAGAGASGILLSSASTQASTLTNSGTITGGSDATNGFGVNVVDGALTLTNQSGGLIAGGTGGIRLASDDLATLNLNAGSTVTGSIISTSSGARTTVLAGLLTGAYDASGGTGVDTFTLASTGSITGAINLGGAADIFNWQGGTFTTVNAGSGADTFSSALGVGNTRTIDQTTLSGFETYQHLSGTLVVDGSRTGGDGWSVTSGASIDLAGSLIGLTGSGRGITVNGNTAGSSVNIRSGAVIDAYTGVWFNGAGVYTFTNAGRISTTGGAAFQSNGATTFTNTGSIADALGYGVSFGTGLSTVTNSGVIAGGSGATGIGIRGGSGGLTVNNSAAGIISGSVSAVTGATGLTTLNNAGLIGTGSVSGGVFTAGGTSHGVDVARATITNSGTISGVLRAISLNGAGLQNTIVNTGTIRGGQDDAISSWGNLNLVNGQTGVIRTDLYAGVVYINGASGTLTNAGSLIGGSTAGSAAGFQSNTSGAVTFNNYGSSTGVGGGIVSFGTGAVTANLFAGSTTGDITLGGANDTLALYNGRGTGGPAVTDAGSGLTLQNAGTLTGALTGTIDLGGGSNTLMLRGGGDGTAANGAAGSMVLGGIGGLSILTKADTGTWTVTGNGAGVSTINAGIGGGDNGLLILNGTGLTSAININGATVRAMNAAALGTGLITMINPTLQFAATDTYNNTISLAATSPTTDPTNLQTFGTGITATLGGAITEATAGQPLVFSSVDANGVASTGTFVLTNTGNSWTGVTTVSAGTTLSGVYNTISGGSITNNGRLVYTGGAGSVFQNITGSGTFTRNGAGALTLAGANNWTGVTTIQSGELRGTTGSISGSSIVNNGVLTYVNATAGTATQAISGSGVIDIAGVGATTLNGNITTSGTLSVSGVGSSLILGGTRSGGSGDSGYGSGVLVNGTNASVTVNGSVLGGSFIGVRVTGQGGSVTNFGTITNTGTGGGEQVGAGVAIYAAGGANTITNGSGSNATASIIGQNNAINQRGSATAALTVNNFGLLSGTQYSAIENSGGAGALTVNNTGGGATIVGRGNAGGGNGIAANAGSALTVTNGGRIIGRSNGISTNGLLTLSNSGTIGAGTLSGGTSGAYTVSGQYGVFANAGGSITNQAGGIIRGGTLAGVYATGTTTLDNAGTISSYATAAFDAVTIIGRATVTNSGTISAGLMGGSGIAVTGAGSTITNSGTITGGYNVTYGYGVQNAAGSGLVTIINQSGGVIGGGIGSILLNGGGDTNIDLRAGSTTNGQILSYANGTHNLTVAGALTGAYNAASGAGVDNITLIATGSMTSANLGAGADSFTWEGGAFSGGLEGGADTDTFNTSLGGLSGTLNLDGVSGFEVLNHNSGGLILTGSGAFGDGISVNGGSLTVNGVLQGDTVVGSGAALGGSGLIDGAVTIANNGSLVGVQGSTLSMGSLSLDSSAIVDATFTGAGGPALFAIAGDLTLDGVVNVSHTGAFGIGVYGLMTYGGALTDNGLTIGATPVGAQRTLIQTSVAGEVNLVHAPTDLLFWDGGNTGQHDDGAVNGGTGTWTAAGSEWTDASGIYNGAMEPQPGFAIFQGAGGVVTVDDVNGAVGVTGIQFASNGYRIQGDSITLAAPTTTIRVGNGTAAGAGYVATIASELTGTGQLATNDLGTLILAGENTYTGGTVVNAGTLRIGDGAAGGSILGSVSVANGSTLVFARNDGHTFANAVSGVGTVQVDGILTLSGPITASNGVGVTAGSNGTLSNVSVTSGSAVTGGPGSTINIAAGGSISSGNGNGVFFNGASGTLNNAGTITAGGVSSGVFGNGALTVTNAASGSITGNRAVTSVQTLDLVNAGVITGTATIFNSSAISSNGAGSITNTGSIYSGTNAIYTGGVGTLTNSGLIQGGGAASVVRLIGADSVVTNLADGQITATGTGVGIYLDNANGSVFNAGSISGGNAVYLVGGGTVTNTGVLTGTAGSAIASAGGTVTNLAGGSVSGLSNGVNFFSGPGSVINAGTITGTNAFGVTLAGGGSVDNSGTITGALVGVRATGGLTLTSSGTISGGNNAIESVGAFNDSLTFLTGSTTGSINTDEGDDLISLAGTLNGALFAGGGADTVTLFDTGAFNSVLDGGDGVDVFVLDGSGVGSASMINVLNFESRVKQGSGVFTLTGGDLSTADWTINGGLLQASGGASINDAVSVTIGANGGFGLLDSEAIGSLNGAGFVDLGDNALFLGDGGTYAGVISGSGGVVLNGGVLTLSGSNTWTGFMDVQGGALTLGASDVLSDQLHVRVATGAAFDVAAFNDTILQLDLAGVLSGSGTLTAAQYLLDGAVVDANLGAGNLFQIGGTSLLNGVSGAGQVSIDAGVLRLGASERLADTANLFLTSTGALDLQGFDETVAEARISGTLNGSGTLTAGLYGLNGATINANLGEGYLWQQSGLSVLNGASAASEIAIDGGVLQLGAADRLSDGATLFIRSDGALDLQGYDEAVRAASISGVLNGTGTLTARMYELDGATVNANLGGGVLYVRSVQERASVLNGTSSAGTVSIQGGMLQLGASERLADSATVAVWRDPVSGTSGSLDIGAFDETVGTLALFGGRLDGTGTVTAAQYLLDDATVNANLGSGLLVQQGGVSTLNGMSAATAIDITGGTLILGAADRLSDAATLIVRSDAVLDIGAFDETVGLLGLSGTLNGSGVLTAARYELTGATVNANLGAGDLVQLSGVSTLNGSSASDVISVIGGTLALGASDRLLDTSTLMVAAGGVLDIGVFNETVRLVGLNGALNGSGTLSAGETQLSGATVNANLAGARLFNLAGVSVLNGTAAQGLVSVEGGTLRLGASERLSDTATVSVSAGATLAVGSNMERIGSLFGMGDVTIGSGGRLTFGGAESGFGGRLSGAGTLVHTAGLFTLTGDHTLGSIVNQGGDLRFLGSTTGALSVTGGTLTGAGTIGGALTVSNGAVLSPGIAGVQNGIGGFTVGGLNLTGGRLDLDVTGVAAGSLIDQIRVLGTAVLTGSTVNPNFQGPAGGFDFSTRYLFLQANSLVGRFTNGSAFTAANASGLYWRVRYDLVDNGAVMELRQLTDFDPGAAGTDNQQAVGSAFNGDQLGASDEYAAVLSVIAGLSPPERAAAFDSVSGEALGDITTSLFSASDHFLQVVQTSGARADDGERSLSFANQLSLSTDRDGGANQLASVLGAFDPGASMAGARGGWVSVFAGDQELEGKAGQATVDTRLNGFAGGYGASHGHWTLGGAAGVSRVEGDVWARASDYESDLTHAAGYVRYDDGQWVADVTAAIYGGEVDTRRVVSVGAFSGRSVGNTHADGQAVSASLSRRFRFEGDGTMALGVMGTASTASVDGFTEAGAGALSLEVSGLERDWQSLNLNARATQPYELGGQRMKVYGGIGVLLTTGDRQATGDMRFTGAPVGSGGFLVQGAETPPVAGITDFGLEVEASDGVTLSAGYRGVFSDRLTDNQIGMKMNVRW